MEVHGGRELAEAEDLRRPLREVVHPEEADVQVHDDAAARPRRVDLVEPALAEHPPARRTDGDHLAAEEGGDARAVVPGDVPVRERVGVVTVR
ncbi:MAG TPA: hypothetical protein VL691_20765, partial [Vicinamibacteria bacterium]|nr:hypothetical protein [Vicinamibacteria bacterium]